jgi:hypothetical protein
VNGTTKADYRFLSLNTTVNMEWCGMDLSFTVVGVAQVLLSRSSLQTGFILRKILSNRWILRVTDFTKTTGGSLPL